MIDAREEILAPVPHTGHRRTAKVSASRESRGGRSAGKKSLTIERVFSDPKTKPFDQIEWEKRTAEITDDAGKVIFKQENVEVPKSWSQLATKVVVSKYFYGEQNTSERETSVRQLIHRICRLFHQYGIGKKSGKGNWFFNRKTGEAGRAATQYEYPQGSACFIQSVQDNMEDIMRLAASEAMLFKYGSGTGTDLSPLRSSKEKLSGGGPQRTNELPEGL